MKNYLLIISCSQRKLTTENPLEALPLEVRQGLQKALEDV